jgi:uncharacterized protein
MYVSRRTSVIGLKAVLVRADGGATPPLEGSRSAVVCHDMKIADRFVARLIGLLNKRTLEPGAGLLIEPCSSIHTFGMKYPIDVLALDRGYRVLGIWKDIRPWSVKVFSGDTYRVLELGSGTLHPIDVQIGDYLQLEA